MNTQLSVSVVIPSAYKDVWREENLKGLITDIWNQTYLPLEIIIVRGARPRTRAHNQGVGKATGDIVIFFDDDVRLGNNGIIAEIVRLVEVQEDLGIIGVNITLAKQSNYFQRLCSKQLLKAKNMVSHAALAITKQLYEKVGGENKALRLNDDADLNYKVTRLGYRSMILPSAYFVYHPEPTNLFVMLKKAMLQGRDQAYDYKMAPEQIYHAPVKQAQHVERSSVARQVWRNIKIIMQSIVNFKFVLLCSRLATALGFLLGCITRPKLEGSAGVIEVVTPANK